MELLGHPLDSTGMTFFGVTVDVNAEAEIEEASDTGETSYIGVGRVLLRRFEVYDAEWITEGDGLGYVYVKLPSSDMICKIPTDMVLYQTQLLDIERKL